MARHEIDLGFAQSTDSRSPIVPTLNITNSAGEVIGRYEFNEHEFLRLLRGGVIRIENTAGGDQ